MCKTVLKPVSHFNIPGWLHLLTLLNSFGLSCPTEPTLKQAVAILMARAMSEGDRMRMEKAAIAELKKSIQTSIKNHDKWTPKRHNNPPKRFSKKVKNKLQRIAGFEAMTPQTLPET